MRKLFKKIHTKPPKKKFKVTLCYRCGHLKLCTWHHIYRRRYGDEWVWTCIFAPAYKQFNENCHDWIHLNPAEAGKEGLYLNHKVEVNKKKSKSKCKKHSPFFDTKINKWICLICKKPMDQKNPFKGK